MVTGVVQGTDDRLVGRGPKIAWSGQFMFGLQLAHKNLDLKNTLIGRRRNINVAPRSVEDGRELAEEGGREP